MIFFVKCYYPVIIIEMVNDTLLPSGQGRICCTGKICQSFLFGQVFLAFFFHNVMSRQDSAIKHAEYFTSEMKEVIVYGVIGWILTTLTYRSRARFREIRSNCRFKAFCFESFLCVFLYVSGCVCIQNGVCSMSEVLRKREALGLI